ILAVIYRGLSILFKRFKKRMQFEALRLLDKAKLDHLSFMKKLLTLSTLLLSLFLLPRAYGQFSIDVESGVAFQESNEIRIFNNRGTLFDFKKDIDIQGPVIPVTVRISYTFNEKNHLFA